MKIESVQRYFGALALAVCTVLWGIRYEQTSCWTLHGPADPVSVNTELVVRPDRRASGTLRGTDGLSISIRIDEGSSTVSLVFVRRTVADRSGGAAATATGFSVTPLRIRRPSIELAPCMLSAASKPMVSPASGIIAVLQRRNSWHQSSDDDPHPAFS